MVIWYGAVCDHCGEACDVFTTSTFHYMGDHYLKEREKTIAEFLDRHYGHELRLIWRDDRLDRLWDEGYDGIHKIDGVLMLRDDSKPPVLQEWKQRDAYVSELIGIERENHLIQMSRIRRMCAHKWILKDYKEPFALCECSVCGQGLKLTESRSTETITGDPNSTQALNLIQMRLDGSDDDGVVYVANILCYPGQEHGYREQLWGKFGMLAPPSKV